MGAGILDMNRIRGLVPSCLPDSVLDGHADKAGAASLVGAAESAP
jgi:hypothetical protein